MLRFLTFFLSVTVLCVSPNAFADKNNKSFESIFYNGFTTIERFGLIGVSLEGSAEKIGLKKENLTDYLRLRFKNSFAGMEFEETENLWQTMQNKDEAKKVGSINVKVWTVGENYPVAYHIAISAGNLSSSREYENSVLGYGSKQDLPEYVREIISKMVDDLAVTFFKARREL